MSTTPSPLKSPSSSPAQMPTGVCNSIWCEENRTRLPSCFLYRAPKNSCWGRMVGVDKVDLPRRPGPPIKRRAVKNQVGVPITRVDQVRRNIVLLRRHQQSLAGRRARARSRIARKCRDDGMRPRTQHLHDRHLTLCIQLTRRNQLGRREAVIEVHRPARRRYSANRNRRL